jgi:hypothetical protein
MIDMGSIRSDAETLARINETLKKCHALGHYAGKVQQSIICQKCGYAYRCDSSDQEY